MTKIGYASPAAEFEPAGDFTGDYMELAIRGLVEIGPGKFRLEGVRVEPLNEEHVAEALKTDDLRLVDEVRELVFKRKLTTLLAERVKL